MVALKDLMAAANAEVPKITPAGAQALMQEGSVLVIDVRDGTEVAASGKIKGAVHISRGLLEFAADAASPMHNPVMRKEVPILLYCGSGGRAALAGKTLKDMGFPSVHNLGGFQAWVDAGYETEPA